MIWIKTSSRGALQATSRAGSGVAGCMTMSGFDRKKHWEEVYSTRSSHEVSWHQDVPGPSLDLIARAEIPKSAPIIDIGGGASRLADHLLASGFHDISVLDISAIALQEARRRLGRQAAAIQWIEADVTRFEPERRYALWHDRAAFHFLMDRADRERYVDIMLRSLEEGGQAIIAAFAEDGPGKCSGLDVQRYGRASMQQALGAGMRLVEASSDRHLTPSGVEQLFTFYRFRRRRNG